jgi:exodeoxyribonuclease VII small subunit
MAKTKPIDKMTFEEAFQELESVVAQLEGGEIPLEGAIELFERGQALSAHCSQLLDKAELKLKQLTPEGETGFKEEEIDSI